MHNDPRIWSRAVLLINKDALQVQCSRYLKIVSDMVIE
jgi:hypothetical protein